MRVMEGRVALVTGPGQGSGRGVALALAAEGAALALVGRTRSKLEIVAEEIEQRGSRSLIIACDVGDPDQIDAAVAATLEHFGQLDTLVNAADTTFGPQPLLATTDEEIELLWSTGPRATLRFMRRCYPHLRGGGSIINFGSRRRRLSPLDGPDSRRADECFPARPRCRSRQTSPPATPAGSRCDLPNWS
jgi:NAD(P)-dependent dehydrogenase (short-subunit alcohol dehydrogenase family)